MRRRRRRRRNAREDNTAMINMEHRTRGGLYACTKNSWTNFKNGSIAFLFPLRW